MPRALVPATVGGLLAAVAFGLTADAVVDRPAPNEREPAAAVVTVEIAPAPQPVRRVKAACRLIVGWPECVRKPAPKPAPIPEQSVPEQPAPEQQQDGPRPGCDWACEVERRANTPAERPAPSPEEPAWPADEEEIELGTVSPRTPAARSAL